MDSDNQSSIQSREESVEELIIRIAQKVPGVGRAKAGAVAAEFADDISGFFRATRESFEAITNSTGKQHLSDTQISELLAEISVFTPDKTLTEAWTFLLGRDFLKQQVDMVEAMTVNNMDINPLLAKALNLETPKTLVSFNVYQSVTRSVVTSWGNVVEEIALHVGCEDNDYKGRTGTNFDLKKTIGKTDYYIQVKSGPNTMNVGMVNSLNDAIQAVEADKPSAKGLLGMTYGVKGRISNQIRGNLIDADERMKVGREFWDFVSGEDNFHSNLFVLLDESSQGILDESFIELIERQIDSLEQQMVEKFGEKVDDILESYL